MKESLRHCWRKVTHPIFCGVLLVSVMILPSTVFAYDTESVALPRVSGDFAVNPGKVELSLLPGESKTIDIFITNRMGKDGSFDISFEDIQGSENTEETVVLLGDDRGPYTLKDSFSVDEMSFVLKNAERARVPVTITMPADAESGGYYASVLFSTTAHNQTGASGAAVVSRIGVLIFVVVPGSSEQSGVLEEFGLSLNRKVYETDPLTFHLLYRNNGTVHLNPRGKIDISNSFGQMVESITVEPWYALPQSLRLREVVWDMPKYAFGRYRATAVILRADGSNVVDTKTLTFWVLPLPMLGAGIVGVIVLLVVMWFIGTRIAMRFRSTKI